MRGNDRRFERDAIPNDTKTRGLCPIARWFEKRLRWPGMKLGVSPQLMLALVILIGGGGLVGGEYFLVRWYPAHKQRMADEALAQVPYGNTALGISLQVAKGIYKKAEILPGEVRLSRPGLTGGGPSLEIKSS